MRVGVLSDTHGLLRPEALAALQGAARILHAGDIGDPAILDALARIAPVVAIRGNNDTGSWARRVPETKTVEIGGVRVHLVHDLKALHRVPSGVDVVVSGHSHRPRIAEEQGVLYLNPGSAGPRRFRLPVTVARLTIGRGKARAEIVDLAVAPPR